MQGLHANEPCKLYTADLAVTPWSLAPTAKVAYPGGGPDQSTMSHTASDHALLQS